MEGRWLGEKGLGSRVSVCCARRVTQGLWRAGLLERRARLRERGRIVCLVVRIYGACDEIYDAHAKAGGWGKYE